MAGVLYDPNNVAVGEAYAYLIPWDKDAVAPLIDDNTELFDPAAWEAEGWIAAGATHEGFKINLDTSTTTITIEEQSSPVAERIESKGLIVEAALAEDTLQSIQLSWGGGTIATQAAGAGQVGTKKMSLTDIITYWTVALETMNVNGMARRFYVPKVSVTGSGETSFRRAADKRTYPLRMASICKPTEIQIVDIVAPATS